MTIPEALLKIGANQADTENLLVSILTTLDRVTAQNARDIQILKEHTGIIDIKKGKELTEPEKK